MQEQETTNQEDFTDVSPDESWVTVSEWMQPEGVEKYGSDGSVFVAKIKWNQPNRLFS